MSRRWYALSFPAPFEKEGLLQFTRSLSARPHHGGLGSSDAVVFEVESVDGKLHWRLGIAEREATQVLGSLRLAMPSVRVSEDTDRVSISCAWELRLSSARRPLVSEAPEQVASALLDAVRATNPGERVRLQWVVGPWLPRQVVRAGSHRSTKSEPLHDLGRLVVDQEQATALRKKQAEPLFGVVGRIAVEASSRGRTRTLLQRTVGALQLMRSPGAGFQRRLLPSFIVAPRVDRLSQPLIEWPCVLSAGELVACLGWPVGNPNLLGVTYRGGRQLPPTPSTLVREPGRGRLITGRSTFPGSESFTALSMSDVTRHVHALGPSGVGKSTLLARMSLDAIAGDSTVIVIDGSAKNDLIRDIADRMPKSRIDDVIILDPLDDRPVGFNVLDPRAPDQSVDTVEHVLRELYAAFWGPRTGDIVHHGLTTLAKRGLGLCELPPLLLNGSFRRQVVGDLRHDALGVGPFWQTFEAWSDGERLAAVGPVLNKIRAFTQRPAIRGVIGQSDGIDLSELFTKRRILLVGLGALGPETGQLLGALLMSRLWSVVQARGELVPEKRRPALLVLDEFQKFLRLPMDLGDALVTARGLGVGLVLGHQHLGQLSSSIRSAVAANAQSRIVFGLGHDDARVMAGVLGGGLDANDLEGLDAYETYQALVSGGRTTPPASVATLPLPPSLGTESEVRKRSREQWGISRAAVDRQLLARRQPPTSDAPVGRRRRGGTS